jgi:hypothetical protein
VLVGSARQMADTLLRRRDRAAVSYISVNALFADRFAPVIELLASALSPVEISRRGWNPAASRSVGMRGGEDRYGQDHEAHRGDQRQRRQRRRVRRADALLGRRPAGRAL